MLILHVLTNDPLPWLLTSWQSLLIWDLPRAVLSPLSYVCMLQGTGLLPPPFPMGFSVTRDKILCAALQTYDSLWVNMSTEKAGLIPEASEGKTKDHVFFPLKVNLQLTIF